jgi:flagellar biosynthesis protein FlhG
VRDQAQRLRELASRSRGGEAGFSDAGARRVLAVASGKGGVGKTSIVANLGTLLARRGLKVMLLDGDFGLANLDILLNLNPRRNLGHLLRGEAQASEVLVDGGEGLQVIPGASGVGTLADLELAEREALLSAVLPLTAGADLVLVDTSAGIGRNVVGLCEAASEVMLVTNPEPTSLTDGYGLLKVLLGRRPDVSVRLLVNSVSGAEEARAVFGKLEQVVLRFLGAKLRYLGHVERDPCVSRATLRQAPFVTAYPRCPAAKCLEKIAEEILGSPPQPGQDRFWRRLLGLGA